MAIIKCTPSGQLMFLKISKILCLSIITVATLIWILFWITSSTPSNEPVYLTNLIHHHMHSRFFRTDAYYGSALLYQAAPFIVVALISYAVIELRKKIRTLETTLTGPSLNHIEAPRHQPPRPRITTYPLIIKSPLGVLTVADVLFMLGILFLVFYSFGRMTYLYSQNLHDSINQSMKMSKLVGASYYMGRSAIIPFALLWIPVSRGSPFLRLIKVPFDHAIKYHIWLSVLTLVLITLHSLGFIIYHAATNTSEIMIKWKVEGESFSALAGLVAWIIGLIIWATSISNVRRRWYEVFFGVHHLYILFFIFWLYHVVWTLHFFIIPCLLFGIDRFLRMLQSQQSVDVLSAKVLDAGSLQLTIAKSHTNGLEYHALSTWYLRFPSLSRLLNLQWHFFSSVTSPSLDRKEELSIMIKPVGGWTTSLRDQLLRSARLMNDVKHPRKCPFSFKARVEGPYGDETDFFLKYKVLILVGGGIGVTPLLALIHDILHRQKQGQEHLPTHVILYHCVRKPEDLCILNNIENTIEITKDNEKHGLNLQVFAYVTSSSAEDYIGKGLLKPSTHDGNVNNLFDSNLKQNGPSITQYELRSPNIYSPSPRGQSLNESINSPQGVSTISTKGNSFWVALTIFSSIVGFYIMWGLSNTLILKTLDSTIPNYQRVHLLMMSMLIGILVFGGSIILVWWLRIKHQGVSSSNQNDLHPFDEGEKLSKDDKNVTLQVISPWSKNVNLRCRPNWNDIFNNLNEEHHGQNVGVLVSGPSQMQEAIAGQCRRHTKLYRRGAYSNVFHYHQVSFAL